MKKFTKVLASFCATAMIFGTFSTGVSATDIEKEDPDPGTTSVVIYEGGKDVNPNDHQSSGVQSGSQAYISPDERKPDQVAGVGVNPAPGSMQQDLGNGQLPFDTDPVSEEGQKLEEQEDGIQEPGVAAVVQAQPAEQSADQPVDQATDQATDQPIDQPVDPEIEPVPAKAAIGVNQQYINNNGYQMPVTSGTYVLEENITVTNCAYAETADQDITIDLNGHTITYVGSENLYVLGKVRGSDGDGTGSLMTRITGVSLTIMDSGSTGLITTGEGYTGSGNTDYWINDTGVGKDTGRGGCILVENGCFLVLNGGTISGFKAADDGGAIHVGNGGSFTMNGGKITNCSAGQGGGGIAVHASSKSKYKPDESISIRGSLVINGGEISGNIATTQGGGIRALRGDLEINGGVIKNNTCKNGTGNNGGGGISVSKNNVNPVMKISGNPKIEDNTCTANSKRNNLFFYDGITISLNGALSSEARIGFSVATNPKTMKCFNTSGNSYDLTSFFCDDSDYEPAVKNGYVMLTNTVPQVEGYRLIVAGEIILETTISLGHADISDVTASGKYSYNKSGVKKDITRTYSSADLSPSGGYYTFRIPVESACITSPITVTINCGSDYKVSADPVTIEQYAKVIIRGNYEQKYKDVAVSLLNYGSVAMMQFNINMNDPSLQPKLDEINANISDPQHTVYTIGEGAPYSPDQDPDGAFYGASVAFLSRTEVNMYFKKSAFNGSAPAMTVTYAGGATETITATTNGNYYMYTVKGPTGDGFAATQFDIPFSYEAGSVSGRYSVETYLNVIEYKYHGQSNITMLYLVERYYDFAKKCQLL